VVLDRRGFVLEEKETLQEVAGLIESEMHPENQIVVADELTDPHPLVVKTAKSLRGARLNDYGIARPRLKGCLDIRVGKASIERAARIMDALIKALDARGIELVRRREILIQRIEQEQGRVDALAKQTKAWQEAQELRAFVQAVRSAAYYPRRTITVGRDIDEWCAWALEQANRIDPTVSSPPSVLDHKKEYFLLR
jgi:hypothetical protein